jgi:hypothetical protein
MRRVQTYTADAVENRGLRYQFGVEASRFLGKFKP